MIPEAPHLRSLGLEYSKARLGHLTALSDLPNLSILDIRGFELDDTVSSVLTKPLKRLQELDISECVFKKGRFASLVFQNFLSGQKNSLILKMVNTVVNESKRVVVSGSTPLRTEATIQAFTSLPAREVLQHVAVGNCSGLLPTVLYTLSGSNSLQIFESTQLGTSESLDPLCSSICSFLAECESLAVLRLTEGYTSKVIAPLLRFLYDNNTLRVLDISNNGLTDIVPEIAAMLSKNKSLMILNIKGNAIKQEGLGVIVKTLDTNTTLWFGYY